MPPDGISILEIWTLQEAARKMIKNSSNKIRRFCKALGMEVIETRYDLYTGLYSELISIVDEIKSCEINRDELEKANQIKLLEKGIKDFTFIHDGINIKNNKIYTPFKSGDQICYSCKSLAIGYLPAFEILKPENYFNENYKSEYESKSEKIIHICCSDWTQYHFVAANNEIASFIYLLKDRLFQIEITETVDSIISYKVERNRIKHCIACEKRFLSHILNERLTNKRQSAIELFKMYHPDNNIFIKFIETVINDLEKLFKKS